MKHRIEKKNKSAIVYIDEDVLNTLFSKELRAVLEDLFNEGIYHVELDLSRVRVTDSSGIGKMLFFYKKMGNAGGKLVIHRVHDDLKETFRVLRLDKLFEMDE